MTKWHLNLFWLEISLLEIYIYNFYFMRRIYFLFSFWISERGNSLELDDRSPGHFISRTSPPAIHLSPSRQSSTSTDGGQLPGIGGGASGGTGSLTTSSGLGSASTGTLVAKKKRELFSSARSSRSGGSNKSSDFDSSCSKVSWCLRPTVLLKSENSAILRSPELKVVIQFLRYYRAHKLIVFQF